MEQGEQTHTTHTIKEVAEALSVVNRHAKAAPDPRHLYTLKKKAIAKLLKEKQAKKIGLHFSNHPKRSQQHSTLLIQVDEYFFHLPPNREDLKELTHLGTLDDNYRNPKPKLNLRMAKQILYDYIGFKPQEEKKNPYEERAKVLPWLANYKRHKKNYFRS
jgi:hypothetical protein